MFHSRRYDLVAMELPDYLSLYMNPLLHTAAKSSKTNLMNPNAGKIIARKYL